jgi:hypothetical protein
MADKFKLSQDIAAKSYAVASDTAEGFVKDGNSTSKVLRTF